MKTLLRYFRYDMTSTLFLIVTIYLIVHYFFRWEGYENVVYWLIACALFIFRGIVWRGFDIDMIIEQQKQMDDYLNRRK
jgi:hypothetical protein